ncbi:MAG: MobF family relaxase, partial [Pseudonocardiaceae bacterium]
MLSVSTGYDVAYLTGPVAGGREGYYTGAVVDAGEPPGLWYGAGAETLGLTGEVDAELIEAVYSHLLDPRDPATHTRATWGEAEALATAHREYRSADEVYATLLEADPDAGPEQRAELRAQAERSARQAVSFLDVTFSAPKSVTVLGVAFEYMANQARAAGDLEAAQAWSAHHQAVEDAVLAGSRAAIDYLQDQAGYSRIGHHGGGAGRWIDAHQFVVAQFLQHDSRNRDPQLHVHGAILNRVLCTDGQWRTLDSQAIKTFRPAAAAVGERVAEAYITQVLGVRFATRPDGKAREILGVPQTVMDLFSSRSHQIGPKAQQLLAEYRDRVGREPSALERYRIAQRATLATRAAKSHQGEDPQQRLDRWEAETRAELAGGLAQVADTVLG